MNTGSVPAHEFAYPLVLEQLIYTWADTTLTGRGFGVVGVSSGWIWETSKSSPSLSQFLAYRQPVKGKKSFIFNPDHEFGATLVLHCGLGEDRSGRAGRYITQVLVDPKRRLTAADALVIAKRQLRRLDWEMSAEPDEDLDAYAYTPPNDPKSPTEDDLARLMLMLGHSNTTEWYTHKVSGLERALRTLPRALVAKTSVATADEYYASRTNIVLPIKSDDAVASAPELVTAPWLDLARRTLTFGAGVPSETATFEELAHELEIAEISALSDPELAQRTANLPVPWDRAAWEATRRFWSSGESPASALAAAASTLILAYPTEVAQALEEHQPSIVRLERALRALPDGQLLAAIAILLNTGFIELPSPAAIATRTSELTTQSFQNEAELVHISTSPKGWRALLNRLPGF